MIKKILMLLVVLILTGCDVNYKIKIDENLNMKEEIRFEHDNKDVDELVEVTGHDSFEQMFNDWYESVSKNAEEQGYSITNKSTSTTTNIMFEKESKLLLLSNSNLKNMYRYISTECNNDLCSIIATPDLQTPEGDGIYPKYKILITVPFKVLKQNADEIDLKNNTYIWYYSLGGKRSDIELVFEKQGKNVVEINKKNSSIVLVIYSIIGITIFGFIGYIIHKIIKNSRPNF